MRHLIRYTGKTEGSVLGSPHWEHPEGEWVKWEDYTNLMNDVIALRIELAEAQENYHHLNKIVKGLVK